MSAYEKQYYVYILANATNVALYIGVTSDLKRRIYEHKRKLAKGFAEQYSIDKLVYYEVYQDPENAILREKRLKGSSRARKNRLVASLNPQWRDLYEEI
jgi:putative endonuclease